VTPPNPASRLPDFTAARRPGGDQPQPAQQSLRFSGCAAIVEAGEDGVVRVTGLMQKPSREEAPSR
jgi:hypothetical protein